MILEAAGLGDKLSSFKAKEWIKGFQDLSLQLHSSGTGLHTVEMPLDSYTPAELEGNISFTD